MSSRRVLKAAQAIREVVSMAIIKDLKDPRIKDVTVTMVEVTPDLRQAKVNVAIRGDAGKQKLCIRGLQNSAGFLQQKIGRRIDTRYTPRLEFVVDKGLENSLAVTRILDELSAERERLGQTKDDETEANASETATDETASAQAIPTEVIPAEVASAESTNNQTTQESSDSE